MLQKFTNKKLDTTLESVPQLVVLGWPFAITVTSSQFAVTMKLKTKLKFVQFLTQTNKGAIMEEMQIDRDGVLLDIEYDYEDADDTVGYNGGVQIHAIKHQGVDIYDLISPKIIESLAQEICERY
jgi:hypothetical protein